VEKIAILHLITELDIGGAEKALYRLLTRLNRERFAPIVACLYGGDDIVGQEIRTLGIPVVDLRMRGRKWHVDAFWRLYRLLRRGRPTILHTWMFHANFLGRITGRLASVPVIITSRRNINIGGPWRERLSRWTAGLDDRVIAVCELARQAEIERARVPPDKVVTVYNGVDPQQFAALDPQAAVRIRRTFDIPAQAPLLGAIGRLHPQKGFTDLLTAMAQVRECFPAARLLLVGDGGLRDDLEAQTRVMDLSEVVTFAGLRTDVPEILVALDLFVLPSLWEGLPNAVLEAMVAALPVVATMVGGTLEVVVDGVTGLLVPPRDPQALAQAINALLGDPERRYKMGQAGRERVRQRFSVKRMVEETESLYEQLLAEKLNLRYTEEAGWQPIS